jgi:hypothetical protein
MAPQSANNFVQVLSAQTQRLPMSPGGNTGVASANHSPQPKSEVKTYGIPNGEASY